MISENELIYLAQENDEQAKDILYQKYKSFIYSIIDKSKKKYNFLTTDIEDLKLECRLIFYNAIDTFNQDKEAKFSTYIKLCIESKLKDTIKRNLTKKARLENNTISLDKEVDGIDLYDILGDEKTNIENNYIDIENISKIINKGLSIHEKEILKLVIKGKDVQEIATLLSMDSKKIYNTIYRLKTKLKEVIY